MNNLENVSISHGTHRPVDLIDSFLYAVNDLDTEGIFLNDICIKAGKTFRLFCILDQNNQYPSPRLYERAGYVIESLTDALNTFAPEGFYFGAHPGDGSDFGFWPVEDDF